MMETGKYQIIIADEPLTSTDDEKLETGVKGTRWKGVLQNFETGKATNIPVDTLLNFDNTKGDILVSNTRKKQITFVFTAELEDVSAQFTIMRPLQIFDMHDATTIFGIETIGIQDPDAVKDDEGNPPHYLAAQMWGGNSVQAMISGENLVITFSAPITKYFFRSGTKNLHLEITYN